MSTKSAVTTDQSADRKDRPKASMLENVQYVTVPAHGVDQPNYTIGQTNRSQELAADKDGGRRCRCNQALNDQRRLIRRLWERSGECQAACGARPSQAQGDRSRFRLTSQICSEVSERCE
jgi:hypothetical protein